MGKKHASNEPQKDLNLKGTFIMVMLLGVLMVATWFGVYGLFLSR